jgi:23S rRNA pseudouridine1911/1915/1917 synthase
MRRPGRRQKAPLRIRIVHEDEEFVVIDKPAGLLSIATERERQRTAYSLVFAILKRRTPRERPFVVHRLDREASGLLVMAKTTDAKHMLQAQFHDHVAARTYEAVVTGIIAFDRTTLRSYLRENAAHTTYETKPGQGGKLAVTHVEVLRRNPARGRTLVRLELETGRKHQVRAQLAAFGHAIVGDPRYGEREAEPARRLALHGTQLRFRHPRSGEAVTFDSPLPDAIRKMV